MSASAAAVRLAAGARELHDAHFAQPAAVAAFAPGRVNLIGEHTDYNGGLVLPMGIERGTAVVASPRHDDLVRVVSMQGSGGVQEFALADIVPGEVTGWPAYVAGAVGIAAVQGWWSSGIEIAVNGDVPLGAGLSSSAALECATLTAIVGLAGIAVAPMDVALAAQRTEHVFAGMPCGIMDQATSMLAREGHAVLLDTATLESTFIPLHLDDLGLVALLIDTNAHHELTDGGYASRRAACEAAAQALGLRYLVDLPDNEFDALERLPEIERRRATHVITENARVRAAVAAFEAADIATIGELFAASHWSLAHDFEVSCPELDLAVTSAVDAGAAAARMTGGGFGGSAITLCRPEQVEGISFTVNDRFMRAGFAAPDFLVVTPSRGAHLVPLV